MTAAAWDPGEREIVRDVTLRLRPEDQDHYVEVPFPLAPLTAAVGGEITVNGPDGTVIDLGLNDTGGTRGWSGGSAQTFFVAEDHASPGYRAGPLEAGRWAVVLGTYRVPAPGVTVEVHVWRHAEGARWLKGDLHIHTRHSDGSWSPPDLARELMGAGLDFVALSDHNTTTALPSFPKDLPIVALPAIEWTTPRGHVNLIGSDRPLRDVRATTPDEVAAGLAEARSRGAFVSINHPFEASCKGCTWDWGFESPSVNALEVWNGLWRPANRTALSFWQETLARGQRIYAVGGTDYHEPAGWGRPGWPTTWVLARRKSREGVLDALRAGHVTITATPDGPRLELRAGAFTHGDEVPAGLSADVTVEAHSLKVGDTVQLWSDRGLEGEELVAEGPDLVLTLDGARRRFWRAEIWRFCPVVEARRPLALTNPLFLSGSRADGVR